MEKCLCDEAEVKGDGQGLGWRTNRRRGGRIEGMCLVFFSRGTVDPLWSNSLSTRRTLRIAACVAVSVGL
jgi:hypothetical protein